MGKRIIRGDTDEQIKQFFRRDNRGKVIAREMAHHSHDMDQWIGLVRTHVEHYVPTPELREFLKKGGRVNHDMLKKLEDRPTVHGDSVAQANGLTNGGPLQEYFKINHKVMRALGSIPTDVLSRHPLFDRMYRHRMQELLQIHVDHLERANPMFKAADEIEVDQKTLAYMERQARTYALNEVNTTLIDISKYSNAAHMFRFVAPFFGAWQASLARWARIMYNNPESATRAVQIWNAPNANGWIRDENGNRVEKYAEFKDSYKLVFQMPERAAKKLGIESTPIVKIGKQSFNLPLDRKSVV